MLQYRREIDGLRALAVIPVILFHAGTTFAKGGFVGVDIFFVISGYLITSIILGETGNGEFSYLRFYERRVRRILPALYFVLVASLPFAWFCMTPDQLTDFGRSLGAVPLFVSNFVFWLTTGYFAPSATLKPLLHTWSLAVEEQYYLIFPVFMTAAWKFGGRLLFSLFGIIALVSFAIAQWGSVAHPTPNFFLLPSRGWEIMIGACLALIEFKRPRIQMKMGLISEFGAGFGLLLILYSAIYFNGQTPFPSAYTLVPTIGTALIIHFATSATFVGRVLGSRALVTIGLMSYSAYLWHQPVFAFFRIINGGEPSPALLLALIFLICVLSYLTWKFVERPFRDRTRFSAALVTRLAVGSSITLICLGTVAFLAGGFPSRYQIDMQTLHPVRSDSLQEIDECFLVNVGASGFEKRDCAKNADGKRFNVLLVGDSHAASLFPALKDYLNAHDAHLGMMTSAFCLPLVTKFPRNSSLTATRRCELINSRIEETLKTENIDLVVVSDYILQWGFRSDPEWSYPTYYEDYLSALRSLASQKMVLVVGQFPVWVNGLPELYLRDRELRRIEDLPRYSAEGLDQALFMADERVRTDLRATRVNYVSATDFFCKQGSCMRYVPSAIGAQLVTFDYGHLSSEADKVFSSEYIGPEVIRLLALHRDSGSAR